MRQCLSLLLGFAPWIVFLIVAGHSLLRLEVAVGLSAVLVLVMALLKLHRGAVLYAGYLFFGAALVFVIVLKNLWFIRHLEVFANCTLLGTSLVSMIGGKPFTGDYARSEVPSEYWDTAAFVRSCYITTSLWTAIFLLNAAVSFIRQYNETIPGMYLTLFSYSLLLSGVIATSIYTSVLRRRRAARSSPPQV